MVYCTMSWKQTLYVIIMHTLIVSSSVAALLFIKHEKIPLNRYKNLPGLLFLYVYVNIACATRGSPGVRFGFRFLGPP
ncbi:unnamed protein product [Eruca vesicaria subsp. sativa]|uniref:Uncharacterized protein n=1 Tax=Eruca vesicaria subsp. sativa TaxID=29727 RepID=A0ABC8KGY1_ERUVS|nr:unnamed protein product [Eruca vesicaria subsp. sativa]